jgi:hypothetical protein
LENGRSLSIPAKDAEGNANAVVMDVLRGVTRLEKYDKKKGRLLSVVTEDRKFTIVKHEGPFLSRSKTYFFEGARLPRLSDFDKNGDAVISQAGDLTLDLLSSNVASKDVRSRRVTAVSTDHKRHQKSESVSTWDGRLMAVTANGRRAVYDVEKYDWILREEDAPTGRPLYSYKHETDPAKALKALRDEKLLGGEKARADVVKTNFSLVSSGIIRVKDERRNISWTQVSDRLGRQSLKVVQMDGVRAEGLGKTISVREVVKPSYNANGVPSSYAIESLVDVQDKNGKSGWVHRESRDVTALRWEATGISHAVNAKKETGERWVSLTDPRGEVLAEYTLDNPFNTLTLISPDEARTSYALHKTNVKKLDPTRTNYDDLAKLKFILAKEFSEPPSYASNGVSTVLVREAVFGEDDKRLGEQTYRKVFALGVLLEETNPRLTNEGRTLFDPREPIKVPVRVLSLSGDLRYIFSEPDWKSRAVHGYPKAVVVISIKEKKGASLDQYDKEVYSAREGVLEMYFEASLDEKDRGIYRPYRSPEWGIQRGHHVFDLKGKEKGYDRVNVGYDESTGKIGVTRVGDAVSPVAPATPVKARPDSSGGKPAADSIPSKAPPVPADKPKDTLRHPSGWGGGAPLLWIANILLGGIVAGVIGWALGVPLQEILVGISLGLPFTIFLHELAHYGVIWLTTGRRPVLEVSWKQGVLVRPLSGEITRLQALAGPVSVPAALLLLHFLPFSDPTLTVSLLTALFVNLSALVWGDARYIFAGTAGLFLRRALRPVRVALAAAVLALGVASSSMPSVPGGDSGVLKPATADLFHAPARAPPLLSAAPAMEADFINIKKLAPLVVSGLAKNGNPKTGLPSSHLDDPAQVSTLHKYDLAFTSIALARNGHRDLAKERLNYVATRSRISSDTVIGGWKPYPNKEGVYGLRRVQKFEFRPGQTLDVDGVVNAIYTRSTEPEGRGAAGNDVTPGPEGWMIDAYLEVDADAFLEDAVRSARTLLKFQRADGAFVDGTAAPDKPLNEPHMSAYSGVNRLAGVLEKKKDSRAPEFRKAANAARQWFVRERLRKGIPSDEHFAPDQITWTTPQLQGDMTLEQEDAFLNTAERRSLFVADYVRGDGRRVNHVMLDFSDPSDPSIRTLREKYAAAREGREPRSNAYIAVGSNEWFAGDILARKAHAVRAWRAGNKQMAIRSKAIAEASLREIRKAYFIHPDGAAYGAYSNERNQTGHYWVTAEGSRALAAGFVVFAVQGYNPQTGEDYSPVYDQIDSSPDAEADLLLKGQIVQPPYTQAAPPVRQMLSFDSLWAKSVTLRSDIEWFQGRERTAPPGAQVVFANQVFERETLFKMGLSSDSTIWFSHPPDTTGRAKELRVWQGGNVVSVLAHTPFEGEEWRVFTSFWHGPGRRSYMDSSYTYVNNQGQDEVLEDYSSGRRPVALSTLPDGLAEDILWVEDSRARRSAGDDQARFDSIPKLDSSSLLTPVDNWSRPNWDHSTLYFPNDTSTVLKIPRRVDSAAAVRAAERTLDSLRNQVAEQYKDLSGGLWNTVFEYDEEAQLSKIVLVHRWKGSVAGMKVSTRTGRTSLGDALKATGGMTATLQKLMSEHGLRPTDSLDVFKVVTRPFKDGKLRDEGDEWTEYRFKKGEDFMGRLVFFVRADGRQLNVVYDGKTAKKTYLMDPLNRVTAISQFQNFRNAGDFLGPIAHRYHLRVHRDIWTDMGRMGVSPDKKLPVSLVTPYYLEGKNEAIKPSGVRAEPEVIASLPGHPLGLELARITRQGAYRINYYGAPNDSAHTGEAVRFFQGDGRPFVVPQMRGAPMGYPEEVVQLGKLPIDFMVLRYDRAFFISPDVPRQTDPRLMPLAGSTLHRYQVVNSEASSFLGFAIYFDRLGRQVAEDYDFVNVALGNNVRIAFIKLPSAKAPRIVPERTFYTTVSGALLPVASVWNGETVKKTLDVDYSVGERFGRQGQLVHVRNLEKNGLNQEIEQEQVGEQFEGVTLSKKRPGLFRQWVDEVLNFSGNILASAILIYTLLSNLVLRGTRAFRRMALRRDRKTLAERLKDRAAEALAKEKIRDGRRADQRRILDKLEALNWGAWGFTEGKGAAQGVPGNAKAEMSRWLGEYLLKDGQDLSVFYKNIFGYYRGYWLRNVIVPKLKSTDVSQWPKNLHVPPALAEAVIRWQGARKESNPESLAAAAKAIEDFLSFKTIPTEDEMLQDVMLWSMTFGEMGHLRTLSPLQAYLFNQVQRFKVPSPELLGRETSAGAYIKRSTAGWFESIWRGAKAKTPRRPAFDYDDVEGLFVSWNFIAEYTADRTVPKSQGGEEVITEDIVKWDAGHRHHQGHADFQWIKTFVKQGIPTAFSLRGWRSVLYNHYPFFIAYVSGAFAVTAANYIGRLSAAPLWWVMAAAVLGVALWGGWLLLKKIHGAPNKEWADSLPFGSTAPGEKVKSPPLNKTALAYWAILLLIKITWDVLLFGFLVHPTDTLLLLNIDGAGLLGQGFIQAGTHLQGVFSMWSLFLILFAADTFAANALVHGLFSIGIGKKKGVSLVSSWEELEEKFQGEKKSELLERFALHKLPPLLTDASGVRRAYTEDEISMAWARTWNRVIYHLWAEDRLTLDEWKRFRYKLSDELHGRSLDSLTSAVDPDERWIGGDEFLRLPKALESPDLSLEPENDPARERLIRWMNTRFMDEPPMPSWEDKRPFTVFTPLYDEAIVYTLDRVDSRWIIDHYRKDWDDFIKALGEKATPAELSDIEKLKDFASRGNGKSEPSDPKEKRVKAALTAWRNIMTRGTADQGINAPTNLGDTPEQYLISRYPDEWENFLKRMKASYPEEKTELDILQAYRKQKRGVSLDLPGNSKMRREVEYWATYRFQGLGRTVRGNMYHRKTQTLHARMEFLNEGNQNIDSRVGHKFRYVVSHQVHADRMGTIKDHADLKGLIADEDLHKALAKKADGRPLALRELARQFPGLEIAYIKNEGNNNFSSVKLRHDPSNKQDDFPEDRRLPLPGHPIAYQGTVMGQGKPGNQNQAMALLSGDLMVMDMNQDHFYEMTLETPNMYAELDKDPDTVIVGYPEKIVTHDYGAGAWNAAFSDQTFVTSGRRVLQALGSNKHFGHPDAVQGFFAYTGGGLNKPAYVNEDTFSAFNAYLHGKKVAFAEYVWAGKTREVSLFPTAGLFTKFGAGAGEQEISPWLRYLYRSPRYSRLQRMSHFFNAIGFYVNHPLVETLNILYLGSVLFLGQSAFILQYELLFGVVAMLLSQAGVLSGFLETGLQRGGFLSERGILLAWRKLPLWKRLGVMLGAAAMLVSGGAALLVSQYPAILGMLPGPLAGITVWSVLAVFAGLFTTLLAWFLMDGSMRRTAKRILVKVGRGWLWEFAWRLPSIMIFYQFQSRINTKGVQMGLAGDADYVQTGRGFFLDRFTSLFIYEKFGDSHLRMGLLVSLGVAAAINIWQSWAIIFSFAVIMLYAAVFMAPLIFNRGSYAIGISPSHWWKLFKEDIFSPKWAEAREKGLISWNAQKRTYDVRGGWIGLLWAHVYALGYFWENNLEKKNALAALFLNTAKAVPVKFDPSRDGGRIGLHILLAPVSLLQAFLIFLLIHGTYLLLASPVLAWKGLGVLFSRKPAKVLSPAGLSPKKSEASKNEAGTNAWSWSPSKKVRGSLLSLSAAAMLVILSSVGLDMVAFEPFYLITGAGKVDWVLDILIGLFSGSVGVWLLADAWKQARSQRQRILGYESTSPLVASLGGAIISPLTHVAILMWATPIGEGKVGVFGAVLFFFVAIYTGALIMQFFATLLSAFVTVPLRLLLRRSLPRLRVAEDPLILTGKDLNVRGFMSSSQRHIVQWLGDHGTAGDLQDLRSYLDGAKQKAAEDKIDKNQEVENVIKEIDGQIRDLARRIALGDRTPSLFFQPSPGRQMKDEDLKKEADEFYKKLEEQRPLAPSVRFKGGEVLPLAAQGEAEETNRELAERLKAVLQDAVSLAGYPVSGSFVVRIIKHMGMASQFLPARWEEKDGKQTYIPAVVEINADILGPVGENLFDQAVRDLVMLEVAHKLRRLESRPKEAPHHRLAREYTLGLFLFLNFANLAAPRRKALIHLLKDRKFQGGALSLLEFFDKDQKSQANPDKAFLRAWEWASRRERSTLLMALAYGGDTGSPVFQDVWGYESFDDLIKDKDYGMRAGGFPTLVQILKDAAVRWPEGFGVKEADGVLWRDVGLALGIRKKKKVEPLSKAEPSQSTASPRPATALSASVQPKPVESGVSMAPAKSMLVPAVETVKEKKIPLFLRREKPARPEEFGGQVSWNFAEDAWSSKTGVMDDEMVALLASPASHSLEFLSGQALSRGPSLEIRRVRNFQTAAFYHEKTNTLLIAEDLLEGLNDALVDAREAAKEIFRLGENGAQSLALQLLKSPSETEKILAGMNTASTDRFRAALNESSLVPLSTIVSLTIAHGLRVARGGMSVDEANKAMVDDFASLPDSLRDSIRGFASSRKFAFVPPPFMVEPKSGPGWGGVASSLVVLLLTMVSISMASTPFVSLRELIAGGLPSVLGGFFLASNFLRRRARGTDESLIPQARPLSSLVGSSQPNEDRMSTNVGYAALLAAVTGEELSPAELGGVDPRQLFSSASLANLPLEERAGFLETLEEIKGWVRAHDASDETMTKVGSENVADLLDFGTRALPEARLKGFLSRLTREGAGQPGTPLVLAVSDEKQVLALRIFLAGTDLSRRPRVSVVSAQGFREPIPGVPSSEWPVDLKPLSSTELDLNLITRRPERWWLENLPLPRRATMAFILWLTESAFFRASAGDMENLLRLQEGIRKAISASA